jgi:hypothetical protein
MRDELNGKFISECYILGVKQYGYTYLDDTGKLIEKSTFAGVPKDSLTFNEIIELYNGKELIKPISVRFFKSIKNLNVAIKPTKITIKNKHSKILVDNIYLPIKISKLNNPLDNKNIFIKLLNKILHFFK